MWPNALQSDWVLSQYKIQDEFIQGIHVSICKGRHYFEPSNVMYVSETLSVTQISLPTFTMLSDQAKGSKMVTHRGVPVQRDELQQQHWWSFKYIGQKHHVF